MRAQLEDSELDDLVRTAGDLGTRAVEEIRTLRKARKRDMRTAAEVERLRESITANARIEIEQLRELERLRSFIAELRPIAFRVLSNSGPFNNCPFCGGDDPDRPEIYRVGTGYHRSDCLLRQLED